MPPRKNSKKREASKHREGSTSREAGKPGEASKSREAGKSREGSNSREAGKSRQGSNSREGFKAGGASSDIRPSVRIIGGGWRGRRVSFPELPGLRPTPDRIRETLFNWLQHSIVGNRCLDLFAGSGVLGLEALSRGAAAVVFVEQAQAAARGLVAELARLGGTAKARVMEMGASRFLRTAAGAGGLPFDIVFMDPPFGQGALAEYIPLLEAGGWVKTGALVYLECEKSAGVPVVPAHWELLKSKSAGEVGYHLARVNARAAGEPSHD